MKNPSNIAEDLWDRFFTIPMKKMGLPSPPKTMEMLLKDAFFGGVTSALNNLSDYLPENEDPEQELATMERLMIEIETFRKENMTFMDNLRDSQVKNPMMTAQKGGDDPSKDPES